MDKAINATDNLGKALRRVESVSAIKLKVKTGDFDYAKGEYAKGSVAENARAIQTDTITPDNLFAIVEMALYHLSPDKHLRKAFRAIKGSQSLEEGADLSRNLVAQACQRRYSKLKGWQRHQGISGHD